MYNRRTFMRGLTVLGSTALLHKTNHIFAGNPGPVFIATWDNREAVRRATTYLESTPEGLEGAIEAGVNYVESDPEDMSVGLGGMPDSSGRVTLDASIMDWNGEAGSVTFLEHIMHPVSVARLVKNETPHVMLSGEGALNFALDKGFPKINLLTKKAENAFLEWKKNNRTFEPAINAERHDTIGLLGMDKYGRLAGACSTSGLSFKAPGRVGDSPIIGAGLFVDNGVGAATATGYGEYIMKSCTSFLIVELMRQGFTPVQACKEALLRMTRTYDLKDVQVGLIAIRKDGMAGGFSLQPGFNYALYSEGQVQLQDAASYYQ